MARRRAGAETPFEAELRAVRRSGRFGIPSKGREAAMLLSRFASVGLLNTLISLSIIMALDRGLRANPQVANAAGYAVGIASGFLLSRRFVFRSAAGSRATAPKYLLTVLAGFCLNQLVLAEAGRLLGAGTLEHLLAQLCAMGSYTVSVFLVCRYWVFRTPIDPVIATA
ncbi:GtrA family protein [Caulobacter sp. S45]|uniref:GtrA family protein n=1 Tax=Caulobacter sp. S45 TaxID=1641861 RepID=UPI00157512C8|nr:GtrA family protein [Caulobacter sp. S45]